MTAERFIQAADSAGLAQRCSAALRTASDLIEAITATLPPEKQAALLDLLKGGGRVGVELTIDGKGGNRICLIGQEREGTHLTFATVSAQPPASDA